MDTSGGHTLAILCGKKFMVESRHRDQRIQMMRVNQVAFSLNIDETLVYDWVLEQWLMVAMAFQVHVSAHIY